MKYDNSLNNIDCIPIIIINKTTTPTQYFLLRNILLNFPTFTFLQLNILLHSIKIVPGFEYAEVVVCCLVETCAVMPQQAQGEQRRKDSHHLTDF